MPSAVNTRCCFAEILLSVFQCTALCVLTDSPFAWKRVLEHVKYPVQSALDAVLLEILLSLFQSTALCVLTDSPFA
jgi:hypothetical protein